MKPIAQLLRRLPLFNSRRAVQLALSGRAPQVKRTAVHDLGMGWAGNTVNTVIFRHHGVISDGEFQFTAFYVDQCTLRLVQRNLTTEQLDFYDLHGQYNLRDAHNSISLGMDRDGYLHISYDHHGSQLRYRRSLQPRSIHGLSDELPMTGAHEERVTYPCFITPQADRDNSPLMLLYRDGCWNKGTARLKVYDEAQRTWSDRPDAILSGAEQRPWTSNPYWNHPVRGTDGSLHLSFVWRTDSLGQEARINNINVCYAKSLDEGRTWLTSRDRFYRLPITQVNVETVHAVSPGSNLINQTSMALDSRNRPHIVFYADDADGIPQYQHIRFDGKQWVHQVISARTETFSLQGGGTLQLPISRPEVLVDSKDNAWVIYRGDMTGNRMSVTKLSAPNYEFDSRKTAVLWSEDLAHAEPIIDRLRWQRQQVLTIFLQHNRQPNGDGECEAFSAPATLLDIQLS